MIAPEHSTGKNRFTQYDHRAERITPADADGFVGSEALPVIKRTILIESNFDCRKLVVVQIRRNLRFGLRIDSMILDTPIEQQDLPRNSPNPAKGINDDIRLAAFDLRLSACRQILRRVIRLRPPKTVRRCRAARKIQHAGSHDNADPCDRIG